MLPETILPLETTVPLEAMLPLDPVEPLLPLRLPPSDPPQDARQVPVTQAAEAEKVGDADVAMQLPTHEGVLLGHAAMQL
jgi:hypothetical protein